MHNFSYRSLICSALLVIATLAGSTTAKAQSVFCPSSVGTQTGISYGFGGSTGLCTNGLNGGTGAFSAAALSSQVIGDVQASVAQQTTTAVVESVSARRATETEVCPQGTERVNGVCVATRRPIKPAKPAFRRTIPEPTITTRIDDQSGFVQYQANPTAPKFAFWTQGFADYERRTATTNALVVPGYHVNAIVVPAGLTFANQNDCNLNGNGWTFDPNAGGPGIAGCVQPGFAPGDPAHTVSSAPGSVTPAVNQTIALQTKITSTSRTGGLIAGADMTKNGILSANDVLIAGVLAGYTDTHIDLTASDTSGSFSSSSVSITGPSIGAFLSYGNGPFSNDTMLKVDFLNLNESFTQVLQFSGASTAAVANSGVAGTTLTNYELSSDFQYRFPINPGWWWEPTGGFRYINSQYGGGAAALGLADGFVWRVQGGLRLGTDQIWNSVRVTTTLTGLAYSDVVVHGVVISGGSIGGTFFGNTLLPSDQGLLRGQGIWRTNFDFGNGRSLFVQADVRGGQGLFGAGARLGGRIQF
jgi:Autotransporter beta-domain